MAASRKESMDYTKYQNLREYCSEMSDAFIKLQEDNESNKTELKYLEAFISYKKLEDEYHYFRENTHEEYEEDMPFPYLTI